MDRETIYDLASIDLNTDSIPQKDNPSNGQIAIMGNKKYADVRDYATDYMVLKKQEENLFRQMLQLEKAFDIDTTRTNLEIENREKLKKERQIEISLLQDQFDEEQNQWQKRGRSLPDFNEVKTTTKKEVKRKKTNWGKAFANFKKWGSVGLFVFVLEGFFGLVQFDFLSEYKSDNDIYLRIAASVFLIVTLHLAENRYKDKGAKQFKYYVVFGFIMLCINLFLPLILNYFFQENIAPSELVSSWDLTSSENGTTTIVNDIDINFIGFLNRFDFIPAILAILIFFLMILLDKSKEKNKENSKSKVKDEPIVKKDKGVLFNKLSYLRSELIKKKSELKDLDEEILKLSSVSSSTVSAIKVKLLNTKGKIDEIKQNRIKISKIISAKLIEVDSLLKIYKTDFKSIMKTDVKSQFIEPSFLELEDIERYYKITN